MDIPARMRQRAGVSLPSREEAHIFRLPPSSKFTRKWEPVSEADVQWMVRPGAAGSDDTRLNENISYFAKGVNPAVEVEYQNRGSAGTRTHYVSQAQVGSAYKLDVVRPPLFPVETLHSLSNPRTHQNISVETNPGLPNGNALNTLADDIDMTEVSNAINIEPSAGPRTVQATAYYKLQTPSVMSAKYAINDNRPEPYETMTNPGRPISVNDFVCREQTPYGVIIRPTYSVTSNPTSYKAEEQNGDASSKVKKEVLLQNIRPNFNIVIYDPSNHISTEVSANIKEKNYIAIQAALGKPITLNRQDGTAIKLKNYNWTCVQTNIGIDQVILTTEDPNIQLERNLPLYASSSGLTAPTDMIERRNTEYDLEGKLEVYAQPNIDLSSYYNQENTRNIQGMTKLNKQTFHSSYENQGAARPLQYSRQLPHLRDNSRAQQAGANMFDRTFE